MWAYEKSFEPLDIQVAQILLTHHDLADRRRFLNARHTLSALIGFGVIPIINENDTVAVDEIRVGDNDTLGRSGLLVHSYLLGPNGDSNGCVSIRNYDQFLNAFQNGVIKRLVVIPRLGGGMSAQRSTSQS